MLFGIEKELKEIGFEVDCITDILPAFKNFADGVVIPRVRIELKERNNKKRAALGVPAIKQVILRKTCSF